MTVICDICGEVAEYVESLPAFTVRKPKYRCGKHKPEEDQGKITFVICTDNKVLSRNFQGE